NIKSLTSFLSILLFPSTPTCVGGRWMYSSPPCGGGVLRLWSERGGDLNSELPPPTPSLIKEGRWTNLSTPSRKRATPQEGNLKHCVFY
ncbi:MAG: hypothetical protein Q8O46_02715, partial [bacterium]|nr:hypothetical protein [bacterium]